MSIDYNICPNLILISENSAISVLQVANWLCREDNYEYSAHEHSAVSDGTKIAQTIEMEHQVFFYEQLVQAKCLLNKWSVQTWETSQNK